MIECPVCSADADENMRFCAACGSQLVGGPPTQVSAASLAAEGRAPEAGEYPAAGWCDTCQGFVWVDAEWACQYGHPRSVVSRWYDPVTGEHLSPPWREQLVNPEGESGHAHPAQESVSQPTVIPATGGGNEDREPSSAAADGPGSRLALLSHLREALNISPMYVADYGEDTDLVVSSVSSEELSELGLPHVEYSAILKAVEEEKVAYLWEVLKESTGGLAFGGIETDLHTPEDIIEVTEESGGLLPAEAETAEVASTRFDFRDTRDLIGDVCSQHGWAVEVVLERDAAVR